MSKDGLSMIETKRYEELLEKEKRLSTLLKAAYDLFEKCNEGPYVKNVLEETAHYDGADCDGYCLKDDIYNELELWNEEGINDTGNED